MNGNAISLPAVPARRRSLPALNALIGGGLLLSLVALALLGLVWTPYDPLKLDLSFRLQA
ncbi:MAG TPA: peptide ABC transporter permease, partial [Achromobacter sp.]|nr:peptide ABC transporter permease [Achromobacter sp.]